MHGATIYTYYLIKFPVCVKFFGRTSDLLLFHTYYKIICITNSIFQKTKGKIKITQNCYALIVVLLPLERNNAFPICCLATLRCQQ